MLFDVFLDNSFNMIDKGSGLHGIIDESSNTSIC